MAGVCIRGRRGAGEDCFSETKRIRFQPKPSFFLAGRRHSPGSAVMIPTSMPWTTRAQWLQRLGPRLIPSPAKKYSQKPYLCRLAPPSCDLFATQATAAAMPPPPPTARKPGRVEVFRAVYDYAATKVRGGESTSLWPPSSATPRTNRSMIGRRPGGRLLSPRPSPSKHAADGPSNWNGNCPRRSRIRPRMCVPNEHLSSEVLT